MASSDPTPEPPEPSIPEETLTIQASSSAEDESVDDPSTVAPTRPQIERSPEEWPTIDGYEILDELGGGGMGVVYKAREIRLNRLVALKMLHSRSLRKDSDERARFQVEAEAVATLQHPNIVQIFQFGEQNGLPFFAMELVEGGTLSARLAEEESLANREAAQIVHALAEAMHYAHQRGIIHRDLKPANILLADIGELGGSWNRKGDDTLRDSKSNHHSPVMAVKISDFGLAKQLDREEGVTTASVAIMGTPGYMAPEQAEGDTKVVGPLADVYGLGAILYELLTGQPPFRGKSQLETIRLVQQQDPVPPTRLKPRVHRDLETICLKCLAKSPQKRYESAEALAEDLKNFLEGEPIQARRERWLSRLWRRARRNAVVTGLILLVLLVSALAGTVGVSAYRRSQLSDLSSQWEQKLDACQPRAEYLSSAEALLQQFREQGYTERAKAEQERLHKRFAQAFQGALKSPRLREEEVASLRKAAQALRAGNATQAMALEEALGQRLRAWEELFDLPRDKAQLSKVFPHNGVRVDPKAEEMIRNRRQPRLSPRPVLHSSAPCEGPVQLEAWFEKGKWDKASSIGLILNDNKAHAWAVRGVAFSPDGKILATSSNDTTIKLWDVATWECKATLYGHRDYVLHVAFSSDGQHLISASGDRTVRIWDWKAQKSLVRIYCYAPVLSALLSPDQKWLIAGDEKGVLRWWKAAPLLAPKPSSAALRATKRIQAHANGINELAIDPEGTTLAVAGNDGKVSLWRLSDQSLERSLSAHKGMAKCVNFSGDGKYLATGGSDGKVLLWSRQGSRPVRRFRGHDSTVWSVAIHPDGKRLISVGKDKTVRIWNRKTGASLAKLEKHRSWVMHLALHPSGQLLATCGGDKSARVWDLSLERQTVSLEPQHYSFMLKARAQPRSKTSNEPEKTIAQARENGMPLHLQILRNGSLIRSRQLKIADGPLHLRASRVGDRLSIQVNAFPPLEVEDLFPLSRSRKGSFSLYWPEGVAVARLRASQQMMPFKPSSLEKGDDAYDRGDFARALEHYASQLRAISEKEAREELHYKQGLCLLKLQRVKDAIGLFEELDRNGIPRWKSAAQCQLWLWHLQEGRQGEADAIFQDLVSRFRFEELVAVLSEDARKALLRAYQPDSTFEWITFDPSRIRNLERALQVQKYLQAPSGDLIDTTLLLIDAHHLVGQIDQGIQQAEKLLSHSDLGDSDRQVVLTELCWMLQRRGQQQKAFDVLNQTLLSSSESTSSTSKDRSVLLLLVRARVHATLKQWKEAEKDVEAFFAKTKTWKQGSDHLSAWLLRGVIRDMQGDAKGAREAWHEGLVLARKLKQLHVIPAAIMGSLTDELTPADIRAMVSGVLGGIPGNNPMIQFFKLFFPMKELELPLQKTWQSARGREYARRIAIRDVSPREFLISQTLLGLMEACRYGAFGGKLTPEQDAICWKMFTDIQQELQTGRVTQQQGLQVVLCWVSGAMGNTGWGALARIFPPSIRGPLAYILGKRQLARKDPKKALYLFDVAIRDAANGSTLQKLAQQEKAALKTKVGSSGETK